MIAKPTESGRSYRPEYTYRRDLDRGELMPALGAGIGVGIGAGLVAFYLVRTLLQRTPLAALPESSDSEATPRYRIPG